MADRIVAAARELATGSASGRAYIADIRDRLPAVSRPEFDRAILAAAESGRISLYQLDDPARARREEARGGLVRTPSGSPRHIVYTGRSG